ncbi:hypothetical protein GCM10010232_48930 [Streptomyces amakusaensis]
MDGTLRGPGPGTVTEHPDGDRVDPGHLPYSAHRRLRQLLPVPDGHGGELPHLLTPGQAAQDEQHPVLMADDRSGVARRPRQRSRAGQCCVRWRGGHSGGSSPMAEGGGHPVWSELGFGTGQVEPAAGGLDAVQLLVAEGGVGADGDLADGGDGVGTAFGECSDGAGPSRGPGRGLCRRSRPAPCR